MQTKNSNLKDMDTWLVNRDNREFSTYSGLSDSRKTEAVSMAAVTAYGGNLEYVPETLLSPEICRAALSAKDTEMDVLALIPYPEVQKEGIKKFLDEGSHPFVVYSFADITDAYMALDAVGRHGYCLQFVPDKLMTADLCKLALQHPESDKKVLGLIPERFHDDVRKIAEEKFGNNPAQKSEKQNDIALPAKKKSIGIS